MPSLKDIRIRIKSVKSTKKITAAMKMIAATKLRKAEECVQESRLYADLMSQMITDLLNRTMHLEKMPKLLVGNGAAERVMVILLTSDRGLCGGFNGNIVRAALRYIQTLKDEGKSVQIVCVGRRGLELISGSAKNDVVESFNAYGAPQFYQAKRIAKSVLELFAQDKFDQCIMFYNRFFSAMTQKVTTHRLIPYSPIEEMGLVAAQVTPLQNLSLFEYEPGEEAVLDQLLPKNFEVQLYRAMLENTASEHGARMTAMDTATRNANDMISRLNLSYNRKRQAIVTNELMEILAGAEAL